MIACSRFVKILTWNLPPVKGGIRYSTLTALHLLYYYIHILVPWEMEVNLWYLDPLSLRAKLLQLASPCGTYMLCMSIYSGTLTCSQVLTSSSLWHIVHVSIPSIELYLQLLQLMSSLDLNFLKILELFGSWALVMVYLKSTYTRDGQSAAHVPECGMQRLLLGMCALGWRLGELQGARSLLCQCSPGPLPHHPP